MNLRVALKHQTTYRFDRPLTLGPHEVRLRPAVHARTPILRYALKVEPTEHVVRWQQDLFGNWVARLGFPGKVQALSMTVELVADMAPINSFDFFVDTAAERYPFVYPDEVARALSPYLDTEPPTPRFVGWLEAMRRAVMREAMWTVDLLVAINQHVQREIDYVVRLEAGVLAPDETLALGRASCRDSAWLLVQTLRRFGVAARFVSGYLIQLKTDHERPGSSSIRESDGADLHAWAEAYLPGAGWIGLDPTSGLLTGEGHIPLACATIPALAAPVIGSAEAGETQFAFSMRVTRL